MSEGADDASKTEDPTAKRLEKAHEEGQWPLSQEVQHFLVIGAILILVLWVFPWLAPDGQRRLAYYFEHVVDLPMDRTSVGLILLRVIKDILVLVWLPVILLLIAGVYATVFQKGWHLSWSVVSFKLSKLNPINGLKSMFSIVPQSVELLKGTLKICVVGGLAYVVLAPMLRTVEHYVGIELLLLLPEMTDIAFRLLIGILVIVLGIAAADVWWQNYQYDKKMKMTKQEVKEEHKEAEGDPQVKARIRQIRFERFRKRMMAAVPNADVVVTNPTHFAVALKYEAEAMNAPMVVAKGADNLALRIRAIAEENDVPIVENPPLARALYSTVEVDEEVPSEHYRAVAEVITYVMKLKGRSGRT